MSKSLEKLKEQAAKFETPFTIKHVETHLIFGPLSRHIPIGYLIIVAGIANLISSFYHRTAPMSQHIGDMVWVIIFQVIALPFILLQITRRQQAIVAWAAVKFALGFGAFLMIMIGGFGGLAHGHRDALPDLFLGLIWLPGVEFIPKITPYQK